MNLVILPKLNSLDCSSTRIILALNNISNLVCHYTKNDRIKPKLPTLPFYLPIAERRREGLMWFKGLIPKEKIASDYFWFV